MQRPCRDKRKKTGNKKDFTPGDVTPEHLNNLAQAIYYENISLLNLMTFNVNEALGYPVGCKIISLFILEGCKNISLFYS
jgi:hypothetical protein